MTTTEPTHRVATEEALEATTSPKLDRLAAALLKDAAMHLADTIALAGRVQAFDRYRSAMLRDHGLPVAEADQLSEHQSRHLGLFLLWDLLGATESALSDVTGFRTGENAWRKDFTMSLHEALNRLEGVEDRFV